MQEIHFISSSAVRALIASAALFAGVVSASTVRAQISDQQDQYEDTAFISRFLSNGGGGDIHFPRPLDPQDAKHIRRIFDLQRQGDFTTAQSETISISDDLLLGDILAERYLNPKYQPSAGQLRLWLKSFSSYADAPTIIKRLTSIAPTGSTIPANHSLPILGKDTVQKYLPTSREADSTTTEFKRNPLLDRTVYERSRSGIEGAKSALHLISITPGMTDLYAAQLQAEVAQQAFSIGQSEFALKTAENAFILSKGRIGLAGYIAGLAAWKQKQYDLALYLFEKASSSNLTAPSIRTGCFFWAARSRLQARDMRGYRIWLTKAAASPQTFYGILAAHIIKKLNKKQLQTVSAELPSPPSAINQVDINTIENTPLGKRFFALLQVHEEERAEIVLQQLWMQNSHNLAFSRSVQLVAQAANLNDLSERMATILGQEDEYIQNATSLPMPNLNPRNGYKVNPALIYALTRLESNFNEKAVSQSGARGLMQLMPVTAKYIAKQQDNMTITTPAELQDSAINLEIGQLYILHLAQIFNQKSNMALPKGGSLVHMLASYNAGPANLYKWLKNPKSEHDPLLFMEEIPVKETKNYLHRAFTYLWIYSDKLDLPSPSLDTLANNHWPDFSKEQQLAQAITLH